MVKGRAPGPTPTGWPPGARVIGRDAAGSARKMDAAEARQKAGEMKAVAIHVN